MGIVINGDVYLKRNPDFQELTHEDMERLSISKIKILSTTPRTKAEAELNKTMLMGINNIFKNGKPIIEPYKHFWTVSIAGDGISMIEQTSDVTPTVKKYNNSEEVEKEFVSLKNFLSEASFMGEELIMGKPLGSATFGIGGNRIAKIEELGILPQGEAPIVLYTFKDRAIIFNQRAKAYEIIVTSDLVSKIFGTYPGKHDEFNKTDEVYQAIYKQTCKKKQEL